MKWRSLEHSRSAVMEWANTPRSPLEVAFALIIVPVLLRLLGNALLSLGATCIARLAACAVPRRLHAAQRPRVRRACVCVQIDLWAAIWRGARLLTITVSGELHLKLGAAVSPPPPPPSLRPAVGTPPVGTLRRCGARCLLRLAAQTRVVARNVKLVLFFVEANAPHAVVDEVRFAPMSLTLTGEKKSVDVATSETARGVLCANVSIDGRAPLECAADEPAPHGLGTGQGHLELSAELAWRDGASGGAVPLRLRRVALRCDVPGAVVRLPATCIARIAAVVAAADRSPAANMAAPTLPSTSPPLIDALATLIAHHCGAGARVTVDVSSIAVEVSATIRAAAVPELVRVRAAAIKLDLRTGGGGGDTLSSARVRFGAGAADECESSTVTLALEASVGRVDASARVRIPHQPLPVWAPLLALPELRATAAISLVPTRTLGQDAYGWDSRSSLTIDAPRAIIIDTSVAVLTPLVQVVASAVAIARHAAPHRRTAAEVAQQRARHLNALRPQSSAAVAAAPAPASSAGRCGVHALNASLRITAVRLTMPLSPADARECKSTAIAIDFGAIEVSFGEERSSGGGSERGSGGGTRQAITLTAEGVDCCYLRAERAGTAEVFAAARAGTGSATVHEQRSRARSRTRSGSGAAVRISEEEERRCFLRVVGVNGHFIVGASNPAPIMIGGVFWLHSAAFFPTCLAAIIPAARAIVDAMEESHASSPPIATGAPRGAIPVPPPASLHAMVRALQIRATVERVTIIVELDVVRWGGPEESDAASGAIFEAARRAGSVLRLRAEAMSLGEAMKAGTGDGPGYVQEPGFGIAFEKMRFEEVQRGSAQLHSPSPRMARAAATATTSAGTADGSSSAARMRNTAAAGWVAHEGRWASCSSQEPFLSCRTFATTEIPIRRRDGRGAAAVPGAAFPTIVDVYMSGVRGRFSAARLLWVWPMLQHTTRWVNVY